MPNRFYQSVNLEVFWQPAAPPYHSPSEPLLLLSPSLPSGSGGQSSASSSLPVHLEHDAPMGRDWLWLFLLFVSLNSGSLQCDSPLHGRGLAAWEGCSESWNGNWGAPLRAGRKHNPVLAVIVVSSCSEGGVTLLRVCFCWQLFISVCLYFCLTCELVLHACSQRRCVCLLHEGESFTAASPLSLVCCKTENDTARSKQLSRATRMQLPWESHANRTSVPV